MSKGTKRAQKVFVGLSGGVDSAVSAALLQRAGFDVTGVFIRIVLPGYPCPAVLDRQEAMRVAAHLRIPFREIDLSQVYKERVFAYSLAEYEKGRTPNPDTLCNREVKFGLFFDYARANGADLVATGHYAQVTRDKKSVQLRVSADTEKDQSYFLWMVPQEKLAHTVFHVGDKKKSEVRVLAKKFVLPNAARKDSQGLCFLGDVSIEGMLEQELHPKKGAVLSLNGDSIGSHRGAMLYTLGQRHGFELTTHTPQTATHYVVAKDIEKNTITVSENKYPTTSTATELNLIDTNWIGDVREGVFKARFRYRQTLIPAEIRSHDEKSARVVLLEPHYIPEGQSLVLYDGDRCLGGGVVDKSILKNK